MKPPERVTASRAELDELLVLVKPVLPAAQYQFQLLEAVLATFVFAMQGLQNAKTSIKRLRTMLFGTRTESRSRVLKELDAGAAGEAAADTSTPTSDDVQAQPPAKPPAKPQPKRPGHGRIGADAYRDAPVIERAVTEASAGEVCPQCHAGKVYDSPPRTIVKVVGQPPLTATVYKLQCLRCRLCDKIFTAPLPEGVSAAPKYDASCASMLALLRYGSGMPFYRLEGLQASLRTPVPDATQWDIVYRALPGPRAACQELMREAAQAPLLHIDDTRAKILSLMAERTKLEAAGQTPESLAIQTTGIVAELGPQRQALLFMTGHNHAGKNLQQVLAQRAQDLAAPMQMSDALACNFTGEFETIVAKCLTHARREVVEVFDHFPQQAGHVINALAQVYVNDAHCRTEGLSELARLLYHQAHSQAVMDDLKKWIQAQFSQHEVEPNSGLGQALRYLLKHWEGLTLFLRKAGAPLDNNVCERALKKAISHRKNSLFYKTQRGAEVGDIYMSLIHTCGACGVNPFEYLQALQIHVKRVLAQAALWLPWNYHEQLGAAPVAAAA